MRHTLAIGLLLLGCSADQGTEAPGGPTRAVTGGAGQGGSSAGSAGASGTGSALAGQGGALAGQGGAIAGSGGATVQCSGERPECYYEGKCCQPRGPAPCVGTVWSCPTLYGQSSSCFACGGATGAGGGGSGGSGGTGADAGQGGGGSGPAGSGGVAGSTSLFAGCDTTGYQVGAPWPTFARCSSREARAAAVGPTTGQIATAVSPPAQLRDPVIAADGTIYVGAYDGNLRAYSPTGTLKWTAAGPASGLSIGVDGTVYAVSDDTLFAVAPTGDMEWQLALGPTLSHTMIGPDGTVYTASSLFASMTSSVVLHAVSPTGTSIWSRPYAGGGVSTLAMRGNRAYLDRSVSVTAVDLTTGDVVFDVGVQATSGLAVAEDGTVYVTQSGGSASRISPDGVVLWTYSFTELGLEGKALCTPPVVAHDGTVRFLASPAGGNGHVYSLDAAGKLAWKASAPTTEFWAGLDAAGITFTGGPGVDVFSPAGDLLFSAGPTKPAGLWGHDGALGNGNAVLAGSSLLTIAP